MARRDSLEVAVITAPHGVHGAVKVRLHQAGSSALGAGRTVQLVTPEVHEPVPDLPRELEVVRVTPIPGRDTLLRVEFAGIVSRIQAEQLRGGRLLVARDSLPALAQDEFYLADAIGLPVFRGRVGGHPLGVIEGVTSNGAQDLFEIRWRDNRGRTQTWLLPVAPGFIREVNDDAIVVDVPPGLLPEELESTEDTSGGGTSPR